MTAEIWPALLPVPAVDDLKKIRGADVSDGRQRYRSEPGAKVCIAAKLYKTAGARSVRINKELEERTGLVVVPGHADRRLRAGYRRDCEGRCLSGDIGIEFDFRSADNTCPACKNGSGEIYRNRTGVSKGSETEES